ncbi:hypothetical protein P7266_1485 [Lactococcus cremoris]|nr:hypothetical protein P7266_1485 [Lactococcus cremoris]
MTKNPNLAIALAIVADILASVPTLVKSWQYPETESWEPFAAGVFNAATSFFAMSIWNFTSLAFPIYLMVVNGLLTIIVLRKKWMKGANHELSR